MQVSIRKEIDLTLVLMEGEVSPAKFESLITQYGPRPTRDVVYLYRNITSNLSSDEAKLLAAGTQVGKQNPDARTCFVIDSNVDYGITRAYVNYASHDDAPERFVCRTMDEAAEFLDRPAAVLIDGFAALTSQP